MLSVLDRAVADPTTTAALVSASESRVLTRAEFHGLAEMPAELEWFANIDNPRTRRAYRNDIEEFSRFVGITKPEEMRSVTRSHLIAWRKQLELRNLAGSTIRRNFQLWPPYSILSVSGTRSPTIQCEASNGLAWMAMKAKRPHSAMARHERSSRL